MSPPLPLALAAAAHSQIVDRPALHTAEWEVFARPAFDPARSRLGSRDLSGTASMQQRSTGTLPCFVSRSIAGPSSDALDRPIDRFVGIAAATGGKRGEPADKRFRPFARSGLMMRTLYSWKPF